MNILYGSTRIVFLNENFAIKIGRFRLIRLFFWILATFINHDLRLKFFKRYGNSFREAIKTYLMTGLNSNQIELKYFKQFPQDRRVMPCITSYLGGWIILQEKGKPVTAKELALGHPFSNDIEANLFVEMSKPEQFCRRKNGKIVLVDYGNRSTCELLTKTLPSLIEIREALPTKNMESVLVTT